MTMTDAERNAASGGHPVGDCDDCGKLHTPWSAHFNDDGSVAFGPGDLASPFALPGVSIGHGCGDCFRLTVKPEYLRSAGPNFHGTVRFAAGHGPSAESPAGEFAEFEEPGAVNVDINDLPALIEHLQAIYYAQQAAADSFVEGWHVDA